MVNGVNRDNIELKYHEVNSDLCRQNYQGQFVRWLNAVHQIMFPFNELSGSLEQVIYACEKLESKYAVCPYLTEEYRNEDSYLKVANILEECAKIKRI